LIFIDEVCEAKQNLRKRDHVDKSVEKPSMTEAWIRDLVGLGGWLKLDVWEIDLRAEKSGRNAVVSTKNHISRGL